MGALSSSHQKVHAPAASSTATLAKSYKKVLSPAAPKPATLDHQSRLHGELHAGKKGDGFLSAHIQLAALDRFGAIQMPRNATHVLMEIGCSDFHTLDEDELPRDASAFLISFEPLIDKYAVLLSRGSRSGAFYNWGKDKAVPLGHHHKRGVVLPLAVSPSGGDITFHVSKIAGCSSMLALNVNTSWGKQCLDSLEERTVPSISLASALGLAGRLPIRHLKIDAQGVDMTLIKSVSAKVLQERVRSISMELPASDCQPLYKGQPRCPEMMGAMRDLGYAVRPSTGKIVGCTRGDYEQVKLHWSLMPCLCLHRPSSTPRLVQTSVSHFRATNASWASQHERAIGVMTGIGWTKCERDFVFDSLKSARRDRADFNDRWQPAARMANASAGKSAPEKLVQLSKQHNRCVPWCADHTNAWPTKCTWPITCGGCPECSRFHANLNSTAGLHASRALHNITAHQADNL
jgi:hypothetical protein